ncbi:sulfide/dihydroorotate dehydrogenase-like FAD/NAD-binding protein [Clostridium sp. JS66]|uniref:sulfide/dihydroorotate dehydrogenase-like FAD/NAD-binding protein n=1 Tax=Clostridium sp. JS66 TaxID=3064705 RepID=UPI00298DE5CD|nr:sulfide/dihydroorotate dehydrogenase-like FAD/NAD-binding protein [Clostridium sp. JS66]WPC41488.1 sulfide/dihydroorotate dehydrogenase-like FAD/NAD-binding protein [Clostridium sp. JS66]
MYEILEKKELAENVFSMDIRAPRVAKSAKPGQFAILRADERAERIPLAICDYDTERGSVNIVFQVNGTSTKKIAEYEKGQAFADFAGPLGQPSKLVNENLENLKNNRMLFIAEGIGVASVYPEVKWLHERGINADVIVSCKSKKDLIMEKEFRTISTSLYISTDDGSYGYKGCSIDLLKELVEKERKKYDYVIAMASMDMMRNICRVTQELGIKTIVSLKSIMVDGIGMCGSCRVTVSGETKFACIDGPEFDGHLVNFEEAIRRQTMYKTEEGKAYMDQQEKEEGHVCHVGLEHHK